MVKSDGGGYRQITDDAFRDRGPKWSPDRNEKILAFYSDRSGRYETWTRRIRPDEQRALEQVTKTTGPARTETRVGARRHANRHGRQRAHLDRGPDAAARPAQGRSLSPRWRAAAALQPRSWSPDGTMLAGRLTFYTSPTSVTLLDPLEAHQYRVMPEGRGWPVWMSDSRRLLVARYDRIVLVDTLTGQATPVLGVAAHAISLSRDDRWLSYIEHQAEADVWMASLER